MTRTDIERRLADAFQLSDDQVNRLLVYLAHLAREPGGAEAVAQAARLSVQVTPNGVCTSRGACYCVGRIVAAERLRPPSFSDVCGLLSEDPAVRAAANARCCACHAPPAICSEACQIGLLHHAECSAGKEPTP